MSDTPHPRIPAPADTQPRPSPSPKPRPTKVELGRSERYMGVAENVADLARMDVLEAGINISQLDKIQFRRSRRSTPCRHAGLLSMDFDAQVTRGRKNLIEK